LKDYPDKRQQILDRVQEANPESLQSQFFPRKKYNSRDRRYMKRHRREFTNAELREAGIRVYRRKEHLPGEPGERAEEIERRTRRYIFDPETGEEWPEDEEEDEEEDEDDEDEEEEE
jgi:hypothetical protein